MSASKNPRYARILLKLSGEALAGNKDMGIDAQVLDQCRFRLLTWLVWEYKSEL